ncbi:MAG: hypothetical protein AAF519_06240 [Bacteroidota bacterium]
MLFQVFFYTWLSLNGSSDCIKPTAANEIRNSDLIATAVAFEDDQIDPARNIQLFRLNYVYKGAYEEKTIVVHKGNHTFIDNQEYLLLAKQDKLFFKIDSCSYTSPVNKADKELIAALRKLPCFDPEETIEKRIERAKKSGQRFIPTGACFRDFVGYVCGCNGKTYGGTCEMNKEGVFQYTLGKCKQ